MEGGRGKKRRKSIPPAFSIRKRRGEKGLLLLLSYCRKKGKGKKGGGEEGGGAYKLTLSYRGEKGECFVTSSFSEGKRKGGETLSRQQRITREGGGAFSRYPDFFEGERRGGEKGSHLKKRGEEGAILILLIFWGRRGEGKKEERAHLCLAEVKKKEWKDNL